MDTYEILSTIRNFSGMQTEDDIGTPLLIRYVNKAKDKIVERLAPLFKDTLIVTLDYASESGSTITLPADVLRIVGLERKDSGAVNRDCGRVDGDNKEAIDKNVNLTASEKYPLYVREGNKLTIYPILSSTDVRLRYRRKICDLIFDRGLYDSGTTLTLNLDASVLDDYYNNYTLAIYQKIRSEMNLVGLYPISDYVGSTKVVTLTGSTLSDLVYFYALVPIIPSDYHDMIVDACLITLKKGKQYSDGVPWKEDADELDEAINLVLGTNIGKWPEHSEKEKS